MPPNVFISYSHADGRAHAEALFEKLTAAGLYAWRDEQSVQSFTDLWADIEQAIRSATHVVVCVTPSIEEDPDSFVRREIAYAQAKGKPILPLVFQGATVPIQINHLRWIEVEDVDVGIAEILSSLGETRVAGPEDPCRGYLLALRAQIDEFLQVTTFGLVPLRARFEPGAVEPPRLRMPVKVVSMPLPVRGYGANAEEEPRAFSTFGEAFAYYGGSVLLLGDPGAGKSTTLWSFARQAVERRLADPSQPLPILAQIPTWNPEAHPDLVTWLADSVPGVKHEVVEAAIASRNIVFFLDALDELGAPIEDASGRRKYDLRTRFLEILPPGLPQVVTCRRDEYDEIGEKLPLAGAVALEPLDDAGINAVLADQPHTWELLRADDDLLSAARTPLVLSLLAFALQGQGVGEGIRGLEEEGLRSAVFDLYLRRRYEHETRKPKANLPFSLERTRAVLERLAMASAERIDRRPFNRVDLHDVSRAVHPWLPGFGALLGRQDARSFLEFTGRMHFLLPEPDGTYRFLHLLLRDHLRCEVALRGVRSRSARTRRRAVWTLYQVGDARAVEPLVLALRDPRSRVRAAYALARLGDSRALPALEEQLRTGEASAREGAVDALAQLGGRRGEELLVEALGDPSRLVSAHAAVELGWVGTDAAVEPLIARLRDPSSSAHLEMARALGSLSPSRALETFVELLGNPDANLRYVAAEALGNLGDVGAVPALAKAAGDPDPDVRTSVLLSLGELGSPDGFAAIAAATADPEGRVRRRAALALGDLGDARAIPVLLALMREAAADPSGAEVREAVVTSLAHRFSTVPEVRRAVRGEGNVVEPE